MRISYVDSLSCKEERKEELRSTYYFECDCDRCTEEESVETAALCQSCRGPIFTASVRKSWSIIKLTKQIRRLKFLNMA